MTVAGTLSQLRVRLSAAAGAAGSSYAFTVKNAGQHEHHVYDQRGRDLVLGQLELGGVQCRRSDLDLGGAFVADTAN